MRNSSQSERTGQHLDGRHKVNNSSQFTRSGAIRAVTMQAMKKYTVTEQPGQKYRVSSKAEALQIASCSLNKVNNVTIQTIQVKSATQDDIDRAVTICESDMADFIDEGVMAVITRMTSMVPGDEVPVGDVKLVNKVFTYFAGRHEL